MPERTKTAGGLLRRKALHELPQQVDMLVIGGGITGAGVALLAAQQGLNVLLVERHDYAWGTSSRSSKMVHGGLRYLAQGEFGLTRESLRERELLLRELPELVHRQPYLFPVYKNKFPGKWALRAALTVYDAFARVRNHSWWPLQKLQQQVPFLASSGLKGAMCYADAAVDDSRLVLRVLHEACFEGAEAVNYVAVEHLERVQAVTAAGENGYSVSLRDSLTQEQRVITAKQVVNATGTWADDLSAAEPKIRPLRGSHLIFPAQKLPVSHSIALLHPDDQRLMFVFPWYGHTVVGTTDLDHQAPKDQEAFITPEETAYILKFVAHHFPRCELSAADIISTQAGVRPIIRSGNSKNPSAESRSHLVWQAEGRITVSGGKLTTFRVMALDVLLAAGLIEQKKYRQLYRKGKLFHHRVQWPQGLGNITTAPQLTETAIKSWWHWAIHQEQVVHLDDLMLRRTHLGNLIKDGGLALLSQHQLWLQHELGWPASRWQQEIVRYRKIWQSCYQP